MFRLSAVLLVALSVAHAGEHPIVGVDPRVELFSIIFRFAGYHGYTSGHVPAYNAAVDSWFGRFRNHQAIQVARDLRDRVGLDAIASLSVHVTEVPMLAERVPFDRPGIALDSRWRPGDARRLLDAARRFVRDTRFLDFLESQRPLIELTNERYRNSLEEFDSDWFERFFGPHRYRFFLVPALLNGTSSYGPRMIDAGAGSEAYCLTGVTTVDAEGRPAFGDLTGNVVHELSHSFANPLIDGVLAEAESAGARLLDSQRFAMRAQGYSQAKTVLYESLVRAATVRYFYERRGPSGADTVIRSEHQQQRSFLWIGELSLVLAEYESERERYATLEQFMFRVVDFFHQAAQNPSGMMARYEERRPKVVELRPAEGARDVLPGLAEIVVRFDRPMLPATSLHERIPDLFPKIEESSWDESRSVLAIKVRLEPERDYELLLNSFEKGPMVSAEGVWLTPSLIFFRTAAAPAVETQ